jgi:HEPN domain-containing protein
MSRNRTEAERWVKQALYDQAAADTSYKHGYHAWACFLCQQAAEKALKAYLYDQGQGPVIGHSTYRLAQECATLDNTFSDVLPSCKQLDQFYIPTRYPNGLPGGVPHEFFDDSHSNVALAALEAVLRQVKNALGWTLIVDAPAGRSDESNAANQSL